MKRRYGSRDVIERRHRWRMEWAPFLLLGFLFLVGSVLLVIGFATFSLVPLVLGNLIISLLVWLIYFWLLLYLIVELQLWRKSRNVGHKLQFIGALLILASPVYMWTILILGGFAVAFTIWGTISSVVATVSLVAGIAIALYGYYHSSFRARDTDLYRNLVVKQGEKVVELTDGYSDRVFTASYDDLPGEEIQKTAKQYALTLGRAGLLLGHKLDEHGVTLYPMTYTGVGTLRVWTALVHLYWFSRKPDRLTWVRLQWDGHVAVHLSAYDYKRINRPVAYHLLRESKKG